MTKPPGGIMSCTAVPLRASAVSAGVRAGSAVIQAREGVSGVVQAGVHGDQGFWPGADRCSSRRAPLARRGSWTRPRHSGSVRRRLRPGSRSRRRCRISAGGTGVRAARPGPCGGRRAPGSVRGGPAPTRRRSAARGFGRRRTTRRTWPRGCTSRRRARCRCRRISAHPRSRCRGIPRVVALSARAASASAAPSSSVQNRRLKSPSRILS